MGPVLLAVRAAASPAQHKVLLEQLSSELQQQQKGSPETSHLINSSVTAYRIQLLTAPYLYSSSSRKGNLRAAVGRELKGFSLLLPSGHQWYKGHQNPSGSIKCPFGRAVSWPCF